MTAWKRLSRSPLSLGLLAQGLQFGFGLLVLPVVLVRLQPAEVGLWHVFVAAQSLVMLLDFGFTQTFARNFAYVFAGARTLMREGIGDAQPGEVSQALLASMVSTARRLYLVVAALSAGALATVGSVYIHSISTAAGLAPGRVWPAWAAFVAAIGANIYFQWQTSLLVGANRVVENYRVSIASRVVQLAVSIAGLLLYPQLSVLVAAYAASVVVMRVYTHFSVRDLLPRAGAVHAEEAYPPSELFSILWHNASRLGLVSLGTFLITRFSTFSIAYFLGLAVSAQYSIAFQAYAVIQSLSAVAFATYLPRISGARVSGDLPVVRSLFARSILFSWVVFVTMTAGFLLAGPWLLQLIGSRTPLPATGVLLLMGLVWFLETNHSNCGSVIVSSNKVPFVAAALVSGAAIALGTTLAGLAGAGLLAFVAVQGAVQLAYNNWKWPLMVFEDLDLRGRNLFHLVRSGAAA